MNKVYKIVQRIHDERGGSGVEIKLSPATDLRNDLSFSSLDLATLTADIEDEFGIDLFEGGFVYTIGDIFKKLGIDENC